MGQNGEHAGTEVQRDTTKVGYRWWFGRRI